MCGMGYLAAGRQLPRNGVHAEFAERGRVDDGQEAEVDAHKEVGEAEVADEEARHVDLGARENEDEDDGAVAQQRHQEDDPDAAAQRPPVEQILARHERTCRGQIYCRITLLLLLSNYVRLSTLTLKNSRAITRDTFDCPVCFSSPLRNFKNPSRYSKDICTEMLDSNRNE